MEEHKDKKQEEQIEIMRKSMIDLLYELLPSMNKEKMLKNKFLSSLSEYIYNSYLHDKSKQKKVNHSIVFDLICLLVNTEAVTRMALLIDKGFINHKDFL